MGGISNAARAARRVRWGRILKRVGTGTAVAGLGTTGYGAVSSAIDSSKAVDAINRDTAENGMSALRLRLRGDLPLFSRLLTGKEELSKYLHAKIDEVAKTPFERRLGHASVDPQVEQVVSGRNAAYLGRDKWHRPVFAFPKGKMGRRVVLHEVGHYLAAKKRPDDLSYMKEYARGASSESSLRNLFRPRLKRDDAGNLTRYGMEAEAWDMGGVPDDDPVRKAALGSYNGVSRMGRLAKAGLIANLLGIGLGIAGKRVMRV